MISFKTACALLGALAGGALNASANPILYYSPAPSISSGLGTPSATLFTQAVVAAFGAGNVRSVADFSVTSTFGDAAALFINLRSGTSVLTGQELANVRNFINAGGAVFFVGEHTGWTDWDNSFLGLYGDSVTTWNSISAAITTANTPGSFDQGQIFVDSPGAIAGAAGIPIYISAAGKPMADLFGPAHNAIAFLDSTPLSNSPNQAFFYKNVASWLYVTASTYETSRTSVPDSDIGAVLAGTLFALVAAQRLSRRRSVAR